jgi:hypothetical protein
MGPHLYCGTEEDSNLERTSSPSRWMESPALLASNDSPIPAYEMKFLLTESEAKAVEHRLVDCMTIDPHADPTLANAYRVTSIYFDTPRLDVYHRTDGYRVHKFRIRRYGNDTDLFLERKSKKSGRVWKQRSGITLAHLHQVSDLTLDWCGAWFAHELAKRQLSPVCAVTYQRSAWIGSGPDGAIRVTMDRAVRGQTAKGLEIEPFGGGSPLLHGEVIVEFKFLQTMPLFFKEIIESMKLSPSAASKYRRCAAAIGLISGDVAYA